jgi:hypothetical protein
MLTVGPARTSQIPEINYCIELANKRRRRTFITQQRIPYHYPCRYNWRKPGLFVVTATIIARPISRQSNYAHCICTAIGSQLFDTTTYSQMEREASAVFGIAFLTTSLLTGFSGCNAYSDTDVSMPLLRELSNRREKSTVLARHQNRCYYLRRLTRSANLNENGCINTDGRDGE